MPHGHDQGRCCHSRQRSILSSFGALVVIIFGALFHFSGCILAEACHSNDNDLRPSLFSPERKRGKKSATAAFLMLCQQSPHLALSLGTERTTRSTKTGTRHISEWPPRQRGNAAPKPQERTGVSSINYGHLMKEAHGDGRGEEKLHVTETSIAISKSPTGSNVGAGSASGSVPCFIFPGGGLFFYWQAGVITYLQESNYDLSAVPMSGASAGALASTLAVAEVDFIEATQLALRLSEEAGVWDRPLGLQGIWGNMIYNWLDELLPENVLERVQSDNLHLLVTPVPSFGKTRISRFESRQDLIDANMASVHLPWFLDGKLTYNYRGSSYIDGSFLAKRSDYFPYRQNDHGNVYSDRHKIIFDFKQDPIMSKKASEFIKVVSKQSIWDILEQGKKYGKVMDLRGDFDRLPRL